MLTNVTGITVASVNCNNTNKQPFFMSYALLLDNAVLPIDKTNAFTDLQQLVRNLRKNISRTL
jgi:hypothetical protein